MARLKIGSRPRSAVCTGPREGSLGVGETLLRPKDAKPLSSSD
jgi:hypothetical protein